MEDFDKQTFKEFVEELGKQRVRLSVSQKMDLLGMFDEINNDIISMNGNIKYIQDKLFGV